MTRFIIPLLFCFGLIAQEFQGRVVENMEALRSLKPVDSRPLVRVLGYYTRGDGGGGDYVLTNTVAGTNVWGGRVPALGGVKSWQIDGDTVSAKQFGAKGDGVADDAGPINAAIQWSGNNQVPVTIEAGTFRVVPWTGMPEFNAFLGSSETNYPFVLSATNATIVGSGRLNTSIVVDRNGYTNTLGGMKLLGSVAVSGIEFRFPFTANTRSIASISITGNQNKTNRIIVRDNLLTGGFHTLSLYDYIENAEISGNVINTIRYVGTGSEFQTGCYGIATVDPHVFKNVWIQNNVITNNSVEHTGADGIIVNVDNVSSRLIDSSYVTNIAEVTISGNYISGFTDSTNTGVQGGVDVAGPITGLVIANNVIENCKNAIWHEWLIDRAIPGRNAPIQAVIQGNVVEFTHRGISFDYQLTTERTSSTGYTNAQNKQVVISGNTLRASTNAFLGFQWGIVGSGNALIHENKVIALESIDPSEHVSGTYYSSGFVYRGAGNMVVSGNEFRGWEAGALFISTQPVSSVHVNNNLFKFNKASYTIDEGGNGAFRPLLSISGNKHDGNKQIILSPGGSILRVDDEYVIGDIKVDVAYLKNGSFGGYGIDQVSGRAHAYTVSGSGFEYYRHLGVFAGQDIYQAGQPARYTSMNGNFSNDNFYMSTNVFRWEFEAVYGNPYIQATGTTNWPNMFRPGMFVQLFNTTTGETHFYTNTMIIACDPVHYRFYLSTNCPTNAIGWLVFPTVTLDGGRKVDGLFEVTSGNVVASSGTATFYGAAGNFVRLSSRNPTSDTSYQWAHDDVIDWQLVTLGASRQLHLYDTNGVSRAQWNLPSGLTLRDPITVNGNITTSGGRLSTATAGANATILSTSTGGDAIAVQYWNTSTNWWNFFMNGTSKDLLWYDQTGAARLNLLQGASDKIPTVFNVSTTFDPPSIAAGASTTTTVSLTGAAVGWRALATHSQLTTQGLMLYAHGSAADTITVVFFNPTGAPVDLGSGNLNVTVFRP